MKYNTYWKPFSPGIMWFVHVLTLYSLGTLSVWACMGGGGGGGIVRSWWWSSLPAVIPLEMEPVSDAVWNPVSLSRGEEEPVDGAIPSSAWNAGDRIAFRTAMIFILSCSEADCRAPDVNSQEVLIFESRCLFCQNVPITAANFV